MMTMLEMVNDTLRRLGKPRVAALDTNGTSTQSEVERCISDASRRLQSRKWLFNHIPKAKYTIVTNNALTTAEIASVPILHVDAADDYMYKNYTIRDGKLFDIDLNTSTFPKDTEFYLQVTLLLPVTDLPDSFAQYVVAQAAFNFNRHFVGNQARDAQLQQEIVLAQSQVNREEILASDVNVLSTADVRSVKGRPAFQYIEGLVDA